MSASIRGCVACLASAAGLSLGLAGPAMGQCAGMVSDKILASDGAPLDQFGQSIDAEGGVLVIGAPGDQDAGPNTGAAYVYAEASAISFAEHVIETAAPYAIGVRIADVDGDGDADILSAWRDSDTIAWHENMGGGTFVTRIITTDPDAPSGGLDGFADGASGVDAGDIDGDGDTDVVSSSINSDRVAWYENLGGSPPTFVAHDISSGEDGAFAVRLGDLDADGDLDVVAAAFGSNQIVWFDNDGALSPTFTRRIVAPTVASATSIDLADVDGDGAMDVLSTSFLNDTLAWHESDGATPPAFTSHTIATDADGAWAVRAGDIDGDGDTDVACASIDDDEVAWFESDGASPPAFTRRSVASLADPRSVDLADVDGDGDVDVVTGSSADHTVAWHESDGAMPPTFTQRTLSSGVLGAWAVDAGDINGDGFIDVASTANTGSVRWFENDGLAWIEQAKLTAPDGATMDYFGWSVALSGDRIMVGAYGDDDAGDRSGAVYVYERSGSAWLFAQKLTGSTPEQAFGFSVDLEGDLGVIGAPGDDEHAPRAGATFVVTHDGASWTEAAKLTATDAAPEDAFGHSVSLSGSSVLIGAKGDDDDAMTAGAAYVFVESAGAWSEQAKLTAGVGVGMEEDEFGYAVALHGDRAAVTAPFADDLGGFSGVVYLFERSGAVWTQTERLLDPAGGAGDEFGLSVDLEAGRLMVGAYRNDAAATNAGSATLFEHHAGAWTPEPAMTAFDAASGDFFGIAVGLDAEGMYVGATRTDDLGANSGAVYTMAAVPAPACDGDIDADGDTDVFDFGILAGNFGMVAGATRADGDLDCDADVDVFDFAIFAADFGCVAE